MKPEHFDRLGEALEQFEHLAALPPDERRTALDQLGELDPTVRAEIERLIAERERNPTQSRAPREPHVPIGADPETGRQIGPYRLLEPIGTGGMGVVWRAEQRSPVRRTVALKLIKAGMDTAEVVNRFAAERQALAMMDHHGVARVYDAGATPEGRPYFAMEYVPGEPITAYADRHRLPIAARLELFIQVCEAVQHAHQKGIIHRDIKPTNVLVTAGGDRPAPKVIDFGVAKATNARLTEATLYTEQGRLIGTPGYMSPEQAEMSALDIDTRTDIYSLGVLLYELLVGSMPFDATRLKAAAYPEIQRIIREEEPPTPSTRLSERSKRRRIEESKEKVKPSTVEGQDKTEYGTAAIAACRRTDARNLLRELKGDLDWITLKALEKDRARRYATAGDLAADVRRYLFCEPVTAGPPGAGYRMRKFVRRHRVGVVAGAAVAVSLVGGVIGTGVGLVRARQAETKAVRSANEAAAISEFLTSMLTSANPSNAKGVDLPVSRLLDRARRQVARLEDQPLVQAGVQETLGRTYFALGRYDDAERLLRSVFATRKRDLGPDARETLRSRRDLVNLLHRVGRFAEAESEGRTLLKDRRRILSENDVDTLESYDDLAMIRRDRGDWAGAESLERKALTGRTRMLGARHRDTLISLQNLGRILRSAQRNEESEKALRDSVDGFRQLLGDDDPLTIDAKNHLTAILVQRSNFEEALALCKSAMESATRILGPEHPELVFFHLTMSRAIMGATGDIVAAEKHLRIAVELGRRIGTEPTWMTSILSDLGGLLNDQKRFDEAGPILQEASDLARRSFDETHPAVTLADRYLVQNLWSMHRFEECQRLATSLIERLKRRDMPGDSECIPMLLCLRGGCRIELKMFDQAEADLTESLRRLTESQGPNDPDMRGAFERMVVLYDKWNRPDKAAEYRVRLAEAGPPASTAAAPRLDSGCTGSESGAGEKKQQAAGNAPQLPAD